MIGPTAADDTMLCLKAFWDGLYGRVGSYSAKDNQKSSDTPLDTQRMMYAKPPFHAIFQRCISFEPLMVYQKASV